MEKTIRERVRAKLKRQKRNQGDLARKLGISGAQMSRILTGKSVPSLRVAIELQDATGIPAREFAKAS